MTFSPFGILIYTDTCNVDSTTVQMLDVFDLLKYLTFYKPKSPVICHTVNFPSSATA